MLTYHHVTFSPHIRSFQLEQTTKDSRCETPKQALHAKTRVPHKYAETEPKGPLSESWRCETLKLIVHGLLAGDARSEVTTSGLYSVLRGSAIGNGYTDVMMGFVSWPFGCLASRTVP
ncbi:hypothetical protein N431DRAFT_425105 [Stipitochalara longipes BDJ]|nr:hypothetical protein N431DRAFT_425105 [Stipitochalara longipes BDJ]